MNFSVDQVLQDTVGIDHVYIIGWSNIVKIGYTNNVLQRFSSIYGSYTQRKYMQNTTKAQLSLLAYVKGDKDLESYMHNLLSNSNVPQEMGIGREWFYINDKILDIVNIFNNCRAQNITNRNVAMYIERELDKLAAIKGLYVI